MAIWTIPLISAAIVFLFSLLGLKAKSKWIRVLFSLVAALALIAILTIIFQMVHPGRPS